MGREVVGDVVMIVIAVWLGVFLEDYESYNPCPPQCKIKHEHRIKNDKSNNTGKASKGSVKEI